MNPLNNNTRSMIRKQIYLTETQDTTLKLLANKTGLSTSEYLRRIIDQYLELFSLNTVATKRAVKALRKIQSN